MRGRVAYLLLVMLAFSGIVPLLRARAATPSALTPFPLPEQIARQHLLANAATYGVTPADLTNLRLDLSRADAIHGAHYLVFLQTLDGIPIHNAVIKPDRPRHRR
jgi:hypothetical protein